LQQALGDMSSPFGAGRESSLMILVPVAYIGRSRRLGLRGELVPRGLDSELTKAIEPSLPLSVFPG